MGYWIIAFLVKKENFWKCFDEIQLYVFEQTDKIKFEEMDFDKFHNMIKDLDNIFYLKFNIYQNKENDSFIVALSGSKTYAFENSFLSKAKHNYKKYIEKDLSTQNKTDQSRKDRENEWIVEYLENLNEKNHYFIVKCLNKDVFRKRYFMRFFNSLREKNKIKKGEIL